MSVIMESIRLSPIHCREKGNARKDCSKLSAWLAGCKRRKLERASDTGKLNCAPNQLGGQGSATTGGEEALRKVTTIDSGMSPCLYRRSQEQGNEWQPSNAWRFNFLDRLSPPTLVSAMLEDFGFIAQCMGSIIGTMAADEKNDWPLAPCYVCRLFLPSGRLHNEDGLSNGSDSATFGTDETTKLPDNITRERWETHTCGWHQDGERHCFTNKLQMPVTVWTSRAQRRTAWRVLNELKGSDGDGWILMGTSLAVATR